MNASPSPVFRKFMIVLASIICVFYLTYRLIFTFNLATPYAVFASVLLYVGEFFGIMNLLLYFLQSWEVAEPAAEPVLEGRSVDVLVPTYNEDVQLLRATLEACIGMDYPHQTYVLDDGRRPEVESLARELGVNYISRADNRHAKAGNLNNALEQTDGEFVVVLDADHVPEPHFITRLIGYFRDDRMAFVQTPHAFYNFDSFQARLDHKNRKRWEEADLFHRVIQPGRNKWNAAIFAGSAAMFRRSALREIGYIATETITEDLHTGLRLHARGWKAIAISERLIAGQAPPDIATFHAQRLRWGEGNLSIMAHDNPLFMRGLTPAQRLCYFGSMIHWASGPFKLAIYLTPILMLFTGVPPVGQFSWALISVTLTYLFISLYTMKVVSNGYGSILNSELFSMANFWTQCQATFRAMFRRQRQRFVVTRKRGTPTKSVWPFVRPQSYLILVTVLAMFWGWMRLSLDLNPIHAVVRLLEVPNVGFTNTIANNINALIAGTLLNDRISAGFGVSNDYFKPVVPTVWCLLFFWLAYKVAQRGFWPADRRFSTRHLAHLPIEYETATAQGPAIQFGVTVDLNDTGMCLVAYAELPLNAVLRFTIRGAGEMVKVRGEVRATTALARRPNAEGFRYGVRFQDLTPPQVDALNRICLQYAVPRLFDEYDRGQRDTFWRRLVLWQSRGMAQRRDAARNQFALPFIVNTGTTDETALYSTTEDVSRVAAAAVFENDIPTGSRVGYLLPTPIGDVRGTAAVVRSMPVPIAGRTYYRCVFEFNEFEGQGRTTIQSLVNPTENAPLAGVLKPDRQSLLPKMRIPIVVGLLIAAPVITLQMGLLFPFRHADDRFLKKMIDADRALTADEERTYRRIFTTTLAGYPSTDRLVLLMTLDNNRGKTQDLEQLTQFLATRDLSNLKLSKALVIAYEKTKKYQEAEKEYERLLALPYRAELDQQEQYELKYAGARIADHLGDHGGDYRAAIDRYRDLYEQYPNRTIKVFDERNPHQAIGATSLRDLYTGVAIKGGDAKDVRAAIEILRTSKVLDVSNRKLLIDGYLKLKDYSLAAAEAKQWREASDGAAEAIQRQADVAGAQAADMAAQRRDDNRVRQAYQTQKNFLTELRDRQGAKPSPKLLIELARVCNALKEYAEAIDLTTEVFAKGDGEFRQAGAEAFVNAAAQVKGIEKNRPDYDPALATRVRERADELYDRAVKETNDRPTFALYQARLGWVLQRLGETDKSSELVGRALTRLPANDPIREQLAGVLLESGLPDRAALVLHGANTPAVRRLMIGIYLREKDYDEAIKLARASYDNDHCWENQKLYADVLSWKGDETSLADAAGIYESRLQEAPDDVAAQARAAEIALWRKKYADAAARYQALLEPEARFNANAPQFSAGFINAAASNPELTPAQVKLAQKLAAWQPKTNDNDPRLVSRLAWVLLRGKDRAGAEAILKAQVFKNDLPPAAKKEVAGVLADAGLYHRAIELLGAPSIDEERIGLAKLYCGARDWKSALDLIGPVLDNKQAAATLLKEARILKADVLRYQGDYQEAIALYRELRKAYPKDAALQFKEAEAAVGAKQFDQALATFQDLYRDQPADEKILLGYAGAVDALGAHNARAKIEPTVPPLDGGNMQRIADKLGERTGDVDPVLLARLALAMYYLNDPKRADLFIHRAMELKGHDPVVRWELANSLSEMKRYREAIALYTRTEMTDDDRRRLIDIATAGEKMDVAVREALILARHSGKPADKKRLADVLAWNGDFAEAIALYEQLLKDRPKDADQLLRIGDIWRWSRNYGEALRRYGDFLVARPDRLDDAYLGYIDAASGLPSLSEPQAKQIMHIYETYATKMTDLARMVRLAWVMIRTNHPDRADVLLNRVLAQKPTDVEVRRELAGALAGRDRNAEAIAVFRSVDNDLTYNQRITYAILLSTGTKEDLAKADRQFRRLLAAGVGPQDADLRVRFAEMLMWSGKYDKKRFAEAKKEFEALAREYPKEVRYPIRIAQCLLWSGQYAESLAVFQDLLDNATITEPQQRLDVWMGFADSLAGSIGAVYRQAALENESPEKYLAAFFTDKLRRSVDKAYRQIDAMKPESPKQPTEKSISQRRYYCESLARLGTSLGLMGDKERRRHAFDIAIGLNRDLPELWRQYAHALTLTGEYRRAEILYDALTANRIPNGLP